MSKTGIAGLTIGVLLVLGGLRAADLWSSRTRTLRAAAARADNLAFIFSQYLHESFAATDASLRQLTIHSRRVGGPDAPTEDWLPSLVSARAGLRNVGSITVVDARGIICHSTRREIVGQSRANDFSFKRLAADSKDELVVSEPFPTVVDPNVFIIPMARRLTNRDGQFDGIVAASALAAAPRGLFRAADLGEHGFVTIYHPNGAILFREPSASNQLGSRADNDPIFQAARRTGTGGRVEAAMVAGGPTFISGFAVLETPPLYVAASLQRDEALAEWRRHERILLTVSLGIAVTMIAILLTLFRQIDDKLRAEQAARQISEEAGRLKEEFLMTVSHELRTPLQSILGWTHVLLAGSGDDANTTKTALETIERNVAAQTRLIDDLLDVSRAVSGKLHLDLHPVDVCDLVGHVVETSRPAANAKSIQLDWSAKPTPPVMADPDRLQQVVWNLVANAIKFTPQGGRVRVAVESDGGHTAIVVADTGIGIPAEFLPHVFERFRQAEASTTRRYGGLGLGLAIVRHLTELHGGVASAESAGPNQGATFTVRLPVHAKTDAMPRSAPQIVDVH
jgi:signal transduction histidine kinase